MCFAPKRRILFQNLNFQAWSEAVVLCTFWLGNVLRATTACTFSTSQLPKVLRRWCALYVLTSKCASHHNGVQFVISHLARWLRTRRFSEPTFRPSSATKQWNKYSESRLCYLFAHLHLLSSHSFSSLIFSLLLFSSLILPTSAFPSVHIVGSLTSKLPSIIYIYIYLNIYISIYIFIFHLYLFIFIFIYLYLLFIYLLYIYIYIYIFITSVCVCVKIRTQYTVSVCVCHIRWYTQLCCVLFLVCRIRCGGCLGGLLILGSVVAWLSRGSLLVIITLVNNG